MSYNACGTCHASQMAGHMTMSYSKPARSDKSQPTGRNPIWYDKLMTPHGFTIEHAVGRPHVMAVHDQFLADRAFGGRFQPIRGWMYVIETGRVWDIIEDRYPDVPGQAIFLPQTRAVGNAVCITCKSADAILDWAWLGDNVEGATWNRTSDVVAKAKTINYSVNCFFCHDPHSAQPRIIQHALIEALTRPEADTLWHADPNRTGINVISMGERGFERRIAILERADSKLMCAQCHIEYSNPGFNTRTHAPIGLASRLTNQYPLVDVFGMHSYYFDKLEFYCFRHKITGARLIKMQHPEVEAFWNSTHGKLGMGCADCHRPTVNGVTDHFAYSPRYKLRTTCLSSGCHSTWTEEQAIYVIDSVKAYTKSRMRKAEFWLAMLVDKFQEARVMGVSEADLQKAREAHERAHIYWEFWTAENSDGFHNPSMARESLTRSITISTNAIDELDRAINARIRR
jgi:formate-dependent nitrite reductase cytochrome c552 subunit